MAKIKSYNFSKNVVFRSLEDVESDKDVSREMPFFPLTFLYLITSELSR